ATDASGALPPLPQRTSTTPREPEPAEPAAPEPPSASQTTPGGLPVRVPQASISPALRTDGQALSSASATAPDDDVPTPEEIRKSFGGLQAGTRRGRTDAAARSLTDATDHTSTPAEDAQEDNQ
ncbi:hypothetical protein ACFFNX_46975, partial [Actinoallomurus acaciae]